MGWVGRDSRSPLACRDIPNQVSLVRASLSLTLATSLARCPHCTVPWSFCSLVLATWACKSIWRFAASWKEKLGSSEPLPAPHSFPLKTSLVFPSCCALCLCFTSLWLCSALTLSVCCFQPAGDRSSPGCDLGHAPRECGTVTRGHQLRGLMGTL